MRWRLVSRSVPMINLLPTDEKREAYKDRVSRAFIVLLGMAGAVFAVGALLFLPSLLLVVAKEKNVRNEIELLNKTTPILQEKELLLGKTRLVNQRIILLENNDFFEISPLVEAARALKGNAVHLSGFFYEYKAATKTTAAAHTLTVNGTADSRDALVSFSRALEESPLFSAVSLPVGNLIQSTAIPFSLSATLTAEALLPAFR